MRLGASYRRQPIVTTEVSEPQDWRTRGVRVIKRDQLDPNTAQTPGMNRAAAINHARVGAQKLWAGTVTIHPNAKTGAHHHGAARERDLCGPAARRGCAGASGSSSSPRPDAGDFIYVPPYVPHQEINASTSEPLECVARAQRQRGGRREPRHRRRSSSPRPCTGSIRSTSTRTGEPPESTVGPTFRARRTGRHRVDRQRIETLAAPADTRHSTLHWLHTYEQPFDSTQIP